jgi:hypothetical protein
LENGWQRSRWVLVGHRRLRWLQPHLGVTITGVDDSDFLVGAFDVAQR